MSNIDTNGKRLNLFPMKKKKKKVSSNQAFDMMNIVADKTDVNIHDLEQTKEDKETREVHAALAAGGFIPGPTGIASDAIDAFLYLKEGKPGQALLAGLSVLPFGSVLFRGMGSGRDVYKSIRVAGKRVPAKDAIKYIDRFETDVIKDFDETAKLFGGGHFPRGVTPSKNPLQLYSTTSAGEATRGYGPSFFRIEMDKRVLKEMAESVVQKGVFKGEKLMYRIDQPFSDVKHFMFSEGLPLNKIRELKIFTDYYKYVNWLEKTKRIDWRIAMNMREKFY